MSSLFPYRNPLWKPPLGAQPDRSHPLSRDLVSWWLFNEGGGATLFDLMGRNHGALTNAPTWAPGRTGSSLSFLSSSDQYVSVPYSTSLDLNGPLTISAWVKTKSGGSGNYGIINQTVGGGTNNHYQMQIETSKLVFRVDGPSGVRLDGTLTFANDTWYFVCGTWDGATAKSYVLGPSQSEVLSASYSGSLNTGSGVLYIGSLGSGVYRMNGQMDDARVYRRALSAAEVQQLYTQPFVNFPAQRRFFITGAGGTPVTVSPSVVTVNTSIPAPTVTGAATVAVSTISVTTSIPAPTVSIGNIAQLAAVSVRRGRTSKPPLGSQLNPAHPLSRGLVGWWLMNEGAGLKVNDLSGNRNTGTLTSGPTWKAGKFGPAVNFDGTDDYIPIADNPPLTSVADGSFTISCWAKILDVSPGSGRILVNRDNTSNTGAEGNRSVSLHIDLSGNAKLFLYPVSTSVTSSITSFFNDGRFHHYVGIRDLLSSKVYLYVDGILAANSTDLSSNINTALEPWVIGRGNTQSASGAFNGPIDDVRIWNRSLSASEVQQLY
jgi:hypothetical protein